MTAPTTPPRCEPPPELRGHDWFHWLEADAPTIGRWYAATDHTGEAWRINSHQHSAQGAHRVGYRYFSPVATPAEVDALRLANDRHEGNEKAAMKAVIRAREEVK